MSRNNVLIRRLPAPKRMQLSNGRVFFAKYKKVNRHALALTQVRITRTYVRKIGARQQRIRRNGSRNRRRRKQQAGAGIDLSTVIDLIRKAVSSKLGEMMITDVIDYILTRLEKEVKVVIDTGVDDYLVRRGVELIGERFN